MSTAVQIASEIMQTRQSGKRCVVLEMENRQEWDSVAAILQRNYLSGKCCLEVRCSRRKFNGTSVFSPVFYQMQDTPCEVIRDELDQARPGSYLAIGLSRFGTDPSVGMILIGSVHLLDAESRAQLLQALTQQLQTGVNEYPLILLTVNRLEQLPKDLFPYVYVIRGRKPDPAEIRVCMEAALAGKPLAESFKREIVSYLQGFPDYEIPYLFRRAELLYGEEAFDEGKKRILELISSEKIQLLERENLLEWKMARPVDLANMTVLKAHLKESGKIMSCLEDAVQNGVDVPKGILILGLPGTGKSLFAQYAAAVLKMPLIRLDMGKMMGGHVGDSERNLRNAQRQAEEMAPCILWIDEIEKGFSGSGGRGREEGAYLRRMTGSFLTWLQEKKSSCYIIATANSIQGLPPEFFRKGRFDECFCTSMPTEHELEEILRVHLGKPGRAHVEPVAQEAVKKILQIATASKRFLTGADAGALVSNTFRRLYLDFCETASPFSGKAAYDREHLLEVMEAEFKQMKVFSETNGPDIADHAAAARLSNFVDASGSEQEPGRYNQCLKAFIAAEQDKQKKPENV